MDGGIQIFIFVEAGVHSEFNTYKLNKSAEKIKYSSVNDIKVFEFLEELYSLPSNNPITKFEIASDITNFLKEQFAGLFHRFLQDQKRLKEVRVLDEMNSVAKTLKELVDFLTEERKNKDEAIKSILIANHPAFRRLAALTKTRYRVYFSTKGEMEEWLKARGWVATSEDRLDSGSVGEWTHESWTKYLKFKKNIFGKNGRLLRYTAEEWDDEWIELASPSLVLTDDDIPF